MSKKQCYVPSCTYDGISSVYSLPKKDPQKLKEMLCDLGFSGDYEPPSSFRVCRKHFTDDSFVTVGGKQRLTFEPKLKNGNAKTTSYSEDDPVGVFDELKQQIPQRIKQFLGWQSVALDDKVFIFLQELDETQGILTDKNIVIDRKKHISAFFKRNKLKIDKRVIRQTGAATIKKWSDLRFVIESFNFQAVKIQKEDPSKQTLNDNSCRVCLSSDQCNLQDLSVIEDDDGETYTQKFTFASCIKIEDLDLPRKICRTCIKDLRIACEIKKKCIETDHVLRYLKQKLASKVREEIVCENKTGKVHEEFEMCVVKTEKVQEEFDLLNMKVDKVHEEFVCEIKNEILEFDGDEIFDFDKPSNAGDTNSPCQQKDTTAHSLRSLRPVGHACIFCDQTFKLRALKIEHLLKDHSDIRVCRVCGRKKNSALSTERCLTVHNNGYPHLCQHCGKGFTLKTRLGQHLRNIHAPESKVSMFVCDICGLKLKYKTSLLRHLTSMHSKGPSRFACAHDGCQEKKYTSKPSLNLHLYRYHNVTAPENCPSCSLGFNNPSEVKVHLKTCAGKKEIRRRWDKQSVKYDVIDGNYQCRLCPKKFSNKRKFGFHNQDKHRDNKTCEICHKTFNSFVNFRHHTKLVHLKIKRFKCDFDGCGKAFGTKTILISHRNTHSGEKPFTCADCDYRTGDQPTLFKHRKNMHS